MIGLAYMGANAAKDGTGLFTDTLQYDIMMAMMAMILMIAREFVNRYHLLSFLLYLTFLAFRNV